MGHKHPAGSAYLLDNAGKEASTRFFLTSQHGGSYRVRSGLSGFLASHPRNPKAIARCIHASATGDRAVEISRLCYPASSVSGLPGTHLANNLTNRSNDLLRPLCVVGKNQFPATGERCQMRLQLVKPVVIQRNRLSRILPLRRSKRL